MIESLPRNLPRLYIAETIHVGQTLHVNAELVHYLRDVLRLKSGDACYVFNGKGGEFLSKVVSFSKKHGEIYIQQWIDVKRESSLRVTLVQGVARGEKMDWIMQKAVELGVTDIQPVSTEYGSVRLSAERWQHKQQHWQAIAVHAACQSGRTQVPPVHLPIPLVEVMAKINPASFDRVNVLSPHAESPAFLTEADSVPSTIAVYIGPEGGFSPTEMMLFQQHGIEALSLGPRILRTETAPLVVLSLLQFKYGDFFRNPSSEQN